MNEVTIVVKAKDQATPTMSKLSGAATKLGAAAGVAAAAIGVKLVQAIGDSIAEAREAQKVTAQTNAVLRSTAGAAGISAKGVEKLATAISKKTGIDDEAIQSGENLLLTFTGIRNEVGKGNDIFNQATATITDMSVALGQDMKTSAIQVGKALNDPVKGMTALRRVGVSFTKSQEDQVKKLVKTGHTLEAQKIILAELRKEFGGSAEAAATWGDKAKVAADNMKEAFGKKLLPALDRVSKWFVKDGAKAIGDFMDSIDTSKLDEMSIAFINMGKSLKKFNKTNDGFKNMLEDQRAEILKWRLAMLKGLIAVADAWGKISPRGRQVAKELRKQLRETKNDFDVLADDINRRKMTAKLKADKSDAQAKIKDIDRQLKKTHNAKVISKLKADKKQAQAEINSINAQLRQLNGKEANVWIRTHRITYYGTKGKPPTNPKGDKKASGGIAHAAEGGMRGNQVLVGEEGPEIVDLPFGSHVNSNADSRRIGMGDGGGGGGVHFHFHGPVYGDHNALKRALVNMKRAGDLDLVLR